MLHRALHGVADGFYVDVGANEPDAESVTKLFYLQGWHGINIEPDTRVYGLLAAARPRDINLQVAAWSHAGTGEFFHIEGSPAYSTMEPGMVRLHETAGRSSSKQAVSTRTLNDIFAEYCKDVAVHFLKVDVEGGELSVILGLDLAIWRPWIILIEAHGEDPTVNYYQPAEDRLVQGGYRFAFADGLNRFYVAQEHWGRLQSRFIMPPNIYDNFIRESERAALARAQAAEQECAIAVAHLAQAETRISDLAQELEELRKQAAHPSDGGSLHRMLSGMRRRVLNRLP